MQKLKNYFYEIRLLIRSVPSFIFSLFVLSVFCMNLLANKSISLPFDWLALDSGMLISWFAFLSMDIITKHFGPKAATELSVIATALNLLFCIIFFIVSKIPGVWSHSYINSSQAIINNALNNTFGGTGYVIFGSTVAFLLSAAVNNFTNFLVGKAFKKNSDSFKAYTVRCYISTALGQFVDNLTFSLIVSHFFFGWSLLQCVTCSITGMVFELICEAVFSKTGYKICKKWEEEQIGQEYLKYRLEKK